MASRAPLPLLRKLLSTRTNWPAGYAQRILPEVDSTMSEAARVAASITGPEWILGLRQTNGRARRGRDWRDPVGNFAASLVLPLNEPPQHIALRSFIASLALHDALSDVTGRPASFALKWPNDVLLNGAKVAGILLEGLPNGVLSVGIGVNLIGAPSRNEVEARAVHPVSVLSETGAKITPEELLTHLATAFARWEDQFRSYGFAPIRTAWLARAARLGDVVTARMPNEEVTGTFETVDDTGSLVLNTPQGRRAITAAEVFF